MNGEKWTYIRIAWCSLLLWALALTGAHGADVQLPAFLPNYFAPAFEVAGQPLVFAGQKESNGVPQCEYWTADRASQLIVANIKCDSVRAKAVRGNVLGYLDQIATSNKGRFVEITETEIHADATISNAVQNIFVYNLPGSVQIWTYSTKPGRGGQMSDKFRQISDLINRQRYDAALAEGNVEMGHWGDRIRAYADQLLKAGRKDEALSVLRNQLQSSPSDYEAHLDFMENTTDKAAASNSATIVFKNAENASQMDKAAKFLGMETRTIATTPVLATNVTGLQVILIPLPPCDAWLLDDAAKALQQIIDVPVSVRRLKEKWEWGKPERIARQRDIQSVLLRLTKHDIDFADWTAAEYTNTLSQACESQDALTRYYVKQLMDKISKEGGQYSVDPYVDRLRGMLARYRSGDSRTMYVGVTAANIYSDDYNFVFSSGGPGGSLLSYWMMMGKTLGEDNELRRRLVERIAKELVPASLKQLGIPRSLDPSCPYSYSSGIERLDQKTLKLSDPVREALEKLKNSTTGATTP
jgi:predicted Zn-dependent protease